MKEQLDLFQGYPRRAGFKERETSKDAADVIEGSGRAESLRRRVLGWYAGGNTGTADECAAALGEHLLAIRPRVTELNKQGRLTKTGLRHRNPTGGDAHVWRLAGSSVGWRP